MKTFFDGIYIDSSSHEGVEYPMKIEYFKTVESEENVEAKYGIEIVLTEFIDGKVNVDNNKVDNLSNKETDVDEILTILRNNEVTPIGMQDVLDDIFHEGRSFLIGDGPF